MMSSNFFPENRAVYEIMWKNMARGAGHRWHNMALAHCRLDNYYRHTIRIFHKSCCSTATMVTWTRLSITLYVHCCFVCSF